MGRKGTNKSEPEVWTNTLVLGVAVTTVKQPHHWLGLLEICEIRPHKTICAVAICIQCYTQTSHLTAHRQVLETTGRTWDMTHLLLQRRPSRGAREQDPIDAVFGGEPVHLPDRQAAGLVRSRCRLLLLRSRLRRVPEPWAAGLRLRPLPQLGVHLLRPDVIVEARLVLPVSLQTTFDNVRNCAIYRLCCINLRHIENRDEL